MVITCRRSGRGFGFSMRRPRLSVFRLYYGSTALLFNRFHLTRSCRRPLSFPPTISRGLATAMSTIASPRGSGVHPGDASAFGGRPTPEKDPSAPPPAQVTRRGTSLQVVQGGLVKDLIRRLVERVLEEEMMAHLA